MRSSSSRTVACWWKTTAPAEIHVVDASGGVSRSIGGSGDGPGEFRNVTELSLLDGSAAAAFDRRLSRVTRFDRDGTLLGSLALERDFGGQGLIAYDAWPLAQGRTLLHVLAPLDTSTTAPVPRLAPRDGFLFVLDSLGAVLHGPLRFVGGLAMVGQRFDAASPFASDALVALGGEYVVSGSGLDFELDIASHELVPQRVIRWPGWSVPIQDEVVDAVRDTVSAGFEEARRRRPEAVAAILDALFAPNALPGSLPVLQRVIVDDTDRIWVAQYRPAPYRWREEDSWYVLDPTGRPLARCLSRGKPAWLPSTGITSLWSCAMSSKCSTCASSGWLVPEGSALDADEAAPVGGE